ncbi:MAG: rhodanese-like domain-containing protein [Cyanobacteria bacterium HKST-UBA06]|nr:rhodanese-like domain-containing protein [Cyanobacteria bacterium HKST-UBA04]MCA9806817.1 rhodanese-like domain-containing protein [Cyanobacteria bacterium HKST-UBA06]MCA9841082.1 rhodanese-like domain-containing protein [Cyanobacteria bacterium HKST-UBA03]
MPLEQIDNATLKTLLDSEPELQVVDVRDEAEWLATGLLPKTIKIPIHELPYAYRMVDPDRPAVVVCAHGARSLNAAYFLEAQGYTRLYNLEHGLAEWDGELEPYSKQGV